MKRSEQFIKLLNDLAHVYDNDERGEVDQLEHCLQMGSKAQGEGLHPRLVALAVLHDAFRVIAPLNHGEALALAIDDVLTPGEKAILENHSVWQHDVVHGTYQTKRFEDSPWYKDGCTFGRLDADSFDPNYVSLPLEFFVPMIEMLLD